MQYVNEVLIAAALTVGSEFMCIGVKRLCKKASCKGKEKKDI